LDKAEATSILHEHVRAARGRSYSDLRSLLRSPETQEVIGDSGAAYQVELQAFWDHRPEGDLRVIVAIDDGGLRAFAPLSDDFIVSPAGHFIGE
jgi:hypothetical protein